MKRIGYTGLSAILVLALALPALAQQPQFKTRAEYDGYMAFFNEKDAKKKSELGEKFLTDYKDTDYKATALVLLSDAYSRAQMGPKVIELADKFAADAPSATAANKEGVYTRAMAAAEATGNIAKMVEFGEMVLKANPGALETLVTLARTLSEQQITDEAQKTANLTKAMGFATNARDAAARLFSGPKPAQINDAQWKEAQNSFEGSIYSTLGMIHLNKNEYDQAISQYGEALKRTPKDDVSYFRMGLAYNSMNRALFNQLEADVKAENEGKTAKLEQAQLDMLVAKREASQNKVKENQDKAIDSLAKAVALAGPASAPARQQLERLYKAKNSDSLEGLEDLIRKAKEAIGTN